MNLSMIDYSVNYKRKPHQVTSSEGERWLEDSKNNQYQLQITWTHQEVVVSQEKRENIVITEFKPIERKRGGSISKNHPWEEFICNIIGSTFFEVKSVLPFHKDRMKYYTNMLRCRPTKFVEMYNACMCKAFIPHNLSHIADKFCRKRLGRFNRNMVSRLNERKEFIIQLEKDNMRNVVPFFLESSDEHSVTSFRKLVGKSTWKKLLRNSESRNKKLAHYFYNRRNWYGEDDKYSLQYLSTLPSSLIPKNVFGDVPSLEEVSLFKHMKILTKPFEQGRISNTVKDCKRMANNLGRCLPKGHTKWNYGEWYQHHEKLVELTNLKKYSKDRFEWLDVLKDINLESENYTGDILDNAFDIRNEGDAMKHCVGEYSGSVENGDYIVISIRNKEDGDRSSTLGLNVYKGEKSFTVKHSQHYKQCNKRVECAEEKEFAQNIITAVNKILNKEVESYEN